MTYDILKFLHIAVAIAWLGGAVGVITLGLRALRAEDQAGVRQIALHTETLAKLIFMPASLVMLALGIALVWMSWSFADAWVVVGILGVVMTGFTGGAILTPIVKKIGEMEAGSEASALARNFYNAAAADMFMLFVIVWDMVSRPNWGDTGEMIAIGLALFAGAAIILKNRA